jgi:hypothetical protein
MASPRSLPIAGAGTCCTSEETSCGSEVHNGLAALLDRYDVNEFAASVKVFAVKPK